MPRLTGRSLADGVRGDRRRSPSASAPAQGNPGKTRREDPPPLLADLDCAVRGSDPLLRVCLGSSVIASPLCHGSTRYGPTSLRTGPSARWCRGYGRTPAAGDGAATWQAWRCWLLMPVTVLSGYPACPVRGGASQRPGPAISWIGADGVIPEGAGRCQAGFGLVVCDGYGCCGLWLITVSRWAWRPPLGAQPPRGSQLKRRMAMMSPAAAPGGEDCEVAPAQPGSCRVRVIRGEEGVRQSAYREDLAHVDQPVRQFQDRDENTGEEAKRKDDGQGDGLGRVDVADEAGHGEAQAGEDDCADDDVEEKSRARPAGDMRREGSPADDEQDSGNRQDGQGRNQGARGDDGAGGQRRGPAALIDAGLPVADNRDDEV